MYSECMIVALVIQYAMRMRRIVICSLPGSTLPFHISHKLHVFRKKNIKRKMYALIFSTTFVRDISHCKEN